MRVKEFVYVLTAARPTYTGQMRSCFDENGVATHEHHRWKCFKTDTTAKRWAKEKGIVLDGITTTVRGISITYESEPSS